MLIYFLSLLLKMLMGIVKLRFSGFPLSSCSHVDEKHRAVVKVFQ